MSMKIQEKTLIKAEKRANIREKRKMAPKGGTLAGELKRLETSKFYKGRKTRKEKNVKK